MISWIRRNEQGILRAFCAVEYATEATLDEMKEFGEIELVEADRIVLNRPLDPSARVLMKL